jgi:hypothetical protein
MNNPTPPPTLRDVVHDMFLAVAPERAAELQFYWYEYSPQFQILEDDGPDGPIVMDAGGFFYVRFNHRVMRLFWLASFALWEGYAAYQHYVSTQEANLTRFSAILDCFEATHAVVDVETVPWPDFLPLPGELVDHTEGDPARVGGELAIFGVSWAVLHELQHLIHQQAGTAADWDDLEACKLEEFSCDAFATTFMLERIDEHAAATGQSTSVIAAKRQLGIYSALFAMTLLSRASWGPGQRHPAVQERVDAVMNILDAHGTSKVGAIIAVSAFSSLQLAYPNAPNPFDAVNTVALREDWNPVDPLFED